MLNENTQTTNQNEELGIRKLLRSKELRQKLLVVIMLQMAQQVSGVYPVSFKTTDSCKIINLIKNI